MRSDAPRTCLLLWRRVAFPGAVWDRIFVARQPRRHAGPAAQQSYLRRSGPLRNVSGRRGSVLLRTHSRRLRGQSPDGPQHGGVRRHHEYLHARSANARVAGTHFGRISAFPCAWAGGQPEPLVFDPVPAPINTDPPFAMQPPDVPNVAAADKETFSDLQARYTVDAKRAASAWKSSMEMNAQTGDARRDTQRRHSRRRRPVPAALRPRRGLHARSPLGRSHGTPPGRRSGDRQSR